MPLISTLPEREQTSVSADLELSDCPMDTEPPGPDDAWAATEATWSAVVPDCEDLTAARDARQAYAVLRGLTARSGAMIAAATTSLPAAA